MYLFVIYYNVVNQGGTAALGYHVFFSPEPASAVH